MSNIIQTAISTSSVYTVVGSNGNCSGIASKTVIVNPLPTITISRTDSLSQDSILCAGTPVHLSATGANSYTWNTGALSPNTVVTPSTSASYTVFGTNSFGCTSGAAIYLNVSACTGIAEKYNTVPEVSLYPNPSSGKISLKNESQEEIRYHVYDLLGRELLKGKFTEHADIDLSGYANGSYVIGLEINGVYTHKKLILEKR
jgi:hypothetical protein